jgi:hypothetical protein
MRHYDVAVASLAIAAPLKWTDNLLSHHQLAGVVGGRRGVARRLSHSAVLHLALARDLHVHLGLTVRDAVAIAAELLADGSDGVLQRGQLRVIVDRPALERTLDLGLRDALESAPSPPRGRPARRRGAATN